MQSLQRLSGSRKYFLSGFSPPYQSVSLKEKIVCCRTKTREKLVQKTSMILKDTFTMFINKKFPNDSSFIFCKRRSFTNRCFIHFGDSLVFPLHPVRTELIFDTLVTAILFSLRYL